MRLARRNFLKAIPAAPFAARKIAESAAANLSQIGMASASENGVGAQLWRTAPVETLSAPSSNQWAKILGDRILHGEIESLYFEQEKSISKIDPDIAVLRSVSLNAKIAYQRERNVRVRLNGLGEPEGWWGRYNKFMKKAFGF